MTLSRASIGMAIRAAREAKCLTLGDLAKQSGLAYAQLSRTELGERDIAYAELLDILEALGVEEWTVREYAKTFEREGIPEKRAQNREIVRLQRAVIDEIVQLASSAHQSSR